MRSKPGDGRWKPVVPREILGSPADFFAGAEALV